MTCVCSRMRMRGERFSSGVKKAATPPSPAFPPTFRAPTGSLGSPLWPRTATSCLRVRQNGTRKTGSLHLRPLSTDPCCPRIMQVNLGFICAPPPSNSSDSEGCFGTFSLQWRRFLNTNHDSVEGWAEDGGVWSLGLHSPHHLPGPRHEEGGPHPTLKGHALLHPCSFINFTLIHLGVLTAPPAGRVDWNKPVWHCYP